MNGQVTAKFEYVRFDGENIRECAKFAGTQWYHNRPKSGEKQFYGIKVSGKETIMVCTGDYLVNDYFGNTNIESIRTFFQKYTVIPKQSAPIAYSEERKHLSPDTIANLIQSNLERNPDGYSIDSLSRTMLGRGDRG